MAAFEASRNRRENEMRLRKLFGMEDDVSDLCDPLDSDESLCWGFDVNHYTCSFTPRLVESTWGDDYETALFGRLGLHCHNVQQGTNFKFVRWEKCSVTSTAYTYFYVTLEAKDPASGLVFSFQTLLSDDSGNEAVDEHWDDTAIDDFYKGAMPKWLSDEELACDNKKYYVVQESELQENDWLHLFAEIAFYSKEDCALKAPQPLEIEKVVVVTKEDTAEPRDKLKAKNAIFYVSYKYIGESSSCAPDQKAIVRKTIDGKPGHMFLEVEAEADQTEEE